MQSAGWVDGRDDEDDGTYSEAKVRRVKRRKTNTRKATVAGNRLTRAPTSLSTLLDIFQHGLVIGTTHEAGNDDRTEIRDDTEHQHEGENDGFELTMKGLLPEYLEVRRVLWTQSSDITLPDDNRAMGGGSGERELVRPLSRFEVARIVASAKQRTVGRMAPCSEWIVLRKLQLEQERRRAGMNVSRHMDVGVPTTVTPLEVPSCMAMPHAVLDGLQGIQTTRYEHSFAARVYGYIPQKTAGLIGVDWESHPPWRLLMDDIRTHYALAHPEGDQPERPSTPISYVSLQACHLRQVHDLLGRIFWDGINVSDALVYAPERCTVIAMYGHLVVGVALLSSPQETYITYLAVRAGFENAQIATTMLYHLIALHPYRDITLHVSANNPAMLLYNRFGFKAEEFITGFYEAYLDAHSKASKNAFRLRLRR